MMRRHLLLALLTCFIATSSSALTGDDLRHWREDLDFVRRELPARHKNLFHAMTRIEFESLVDKLAADLPKLEQHEVIVRLAQIVARAGDRDGHSGVSLRPPSTSFHLLPINFFVYSDGLHVRAAAREYANIAGARVVSIGSAGVDEAIRRAMTLASGDNEMSRKADVAIILAIPEVLRALGLADGRPNAPIEITGVQPDGRRVSARVQGVDKTDAVDWLDIRRGDHEFLYLRYANPNPFRWYAPSKALWFEYMPGPKMLYVHYGAVANTPDETVASFFARVFEFAASNVVDKFVVDLRHNGGGDNTLNRPFLHGMIKREDTLGRAGHFFVLVGRHTFSAAQNIATQLEAHTNVIFAGEPTGGSPNHYGDPTRIKLPNSGVIVRVSTLWWQDAPPDDQRLTITPALSAPISSADDRTGRDAALEAVLRY